MRFMPLAKRSRARAELFNAAGVAVEAAKLVFFVAMILFAISAVVGLVRGRSPTARRLVWATDETNDRRADFMVQAHQGANIRLQN